MDVEKVADALFKLVQGYVEKSVAPLHEKIRELESREPVIGPRGEKGDSGSDGVDGKSVEVSEVMPALEAKLDAAIAAIPVPKDGQDGLDGSDGADGESITLEDILPVLQDMQAKWELNFERRATEKLDKAIERIPSPKDGKDADPDVIVHKVLSRLTPSGIDKDEVADICKGLVDAIPKPKNGKNATDDQVFEAVRKFLDVNPVKDGIDGANGADGKDGRDGIDGRDGSNGIDGKDGKDGASGIDGKDGSPGADGRDGIDGKDGIQGKDGADGINGKDGADGTSVTVEDLLPVLKSMQSEWALDFEKRAQDVLQKAIDRMPRPKDGADGLSLEDFEVSMNGRTMKLALVRGDIRKEFEINLAIPMYREIWKSGETYQPGDFVTYDGSVWACLKTTKGKPGEYTKDWRLAVKRGRNGKSAKDSD